MYPAGSSYTKTHRTLPLFLLAAAFFILCLPCLHGQRLREEAISPTRLKGAQLYQFFNHIEWGSGKNEDIYRIGIAGDNTELFRELSSNLRDKRLNGRGFEILRVRKPLSAEENLHVLYLSQDLEDSLKEITSNLRRTGTLIVSEEFEDTRNVMINFFQTEGDKIQFLVNRPQIVLEGISISPDILLLGGTEMDVATVYYQMLDELVSIRDQLDQRTAEIDLKTREIEQRNNLLESQNEFMDSQASRIDELSGEIASREKALSEVENSLSAYRKDAAQTEKQLEEYQTQLEERKLALEASEGLMVQQSQRIEVISAKLESEEEKLSKQRSLLETQESEIKQQVDILASQSSIIKNQRRAIIYVIAASVFVLIGTGLLLRLNHMRKRTMSKLAEANSDLEKARTDAEKANKAKSKFLSSISHEIRTPLNAIIGYSQVLNREKGLQAKQSEFVGSILRSGNHLLTLLNDVLSMSKIESGKVSIKAQYCDLSKLCDDLYLMFSFKAQERHLDFAYEIDERVPATIETDTGKLRQVLINLLGNAFKFTHEGAVSLSVSSRKIAENEAIIKFNVSDTGKGIDPSNLERIFDAFEQGKAGENALEGTGLGLAISKQYAQLLGGDITVESQKFSGSTFTCTIKCKTVDSTDDLANTSKVNASKYRPIDESSPVLVIDDLADNRDILSLMLEKIGFKTIEASSAEQGLHLLEEYVPQLILTDLKMPDVSGEEFAIKVKRQDRFTNIPIIGVTAQALDDLSTKTPPNMKCVITKPIQEELLFERICSLTSLLKKEPESHSPSKAPPLADELPEGLRERIHDAAVAGDFREIEEHLEKIKESAPNSYKQIKKLVEEFALHEIANLTE